MPRSAPAWPDFESPLLQAISAALRRRGKAIRYHARLVCQQEWEESADRVRERLNIDLAGTVKVRLSVWCDGVMWLCVCQGASGSHAGWAFQEQFHGEVRSLPAAEVVQRLEETWALSLPPRPTDCAQQLRRLWDVVSEEEA
jgi:hypothetical protein